MITESLETLRNFTLFSTFNDQQCDYIKENVKQIIIPERKVILKRGAEHEIIFVLLKGKLKLTAKDGKTEIIHADSKRAKDAIARIRPSLYTISTLTQVKIISLSKEILEHAIGIKASKETDPSITISKNINSEKKITEDKILIDIINLLHNDQLVLPSMPDIALKIRHAVEDEDSDLNDVIKIINMDQSIVAKVINTANSAMYNTSGKKVENIKVACTRLGGKMIMNLVLSYAMKDLFHTSSSLFKAKMNDMWQHSVKVAAISFILARLTPGFDPEKALLAGLLHNIGPVVVLNYLSEEQIKIEDEEQLDHILYTLQSEVGESLLTKWGFSEDLIEVVKFSTDLSHDNCDKATYVDIVNISQIHAYIGTPQQNKMPIINQIPAFNKLALGNLTPELSIKVLHTSQAEIDTTISLFS